MCFCQKESRCEQEQKDTRAVSFCDHICYLTSIVVFDNVIHIDHLAWTQREEQCHDAEGIYKQEEAARETEKTLCVTCKAQHVSKSNGKC